MSLLLSSLISHHRHFVILVIVLSSLSLSFCHHCRHHSLVIIIFTFPSFLSLSFCRHRRHSFVIILSLLLLFNHHCHFHRFVIVVVIVILSSYSWSFVIVIVIVSPLAFSLGFPSFNPPSPPSSPFSTLRLFRLLLKSSSQKRKSANSEPSDRIRIRTLRSRLSKNTLSMKFDYMLD